MGFNSKGEWVAEYSGTPWYDEQQAALKQAQAPQPPPVSTTGPVQPPMPVSTSPVWKQPPSMQSPGGPGGPIQGFPPDLIAELRRLGWGNPPGQPGQPVKKPGGFTQPAQPLGPPPYGMIANPNYDPNSTQMSGTWYGDVPGTPGRDPNMPGYDPRPLDPHGQWIRDPNVSTDQFLAKGGFGQPGQPPSMGSPGGPMEPPSMTSPGGPAPSPTRPYLDNPNPPTQDSGNPPSMTSPGGPAPPPTGPYLDNPNPPPTRATPPQEISDFEKMLNGQYDPKTGGYNWGGQPVGGGTKAGGVISTSPDAGPYSTGNFNDQNKPLPQGKPSAPGVGSTGVSTGWAGGVQPSAYDSSPLSTQAGTGGNQIPQPAAAPAPSPSAPPAYGGGDQSGLNNVQPSPTPTPAAAPAPSAPKRKVATGGGGQTSPWG